VIRFARADASALLRMLPSAALFGALALGGWLLAQWFWYFATPTEVAPAAPRTKVHLAAAAETLVGAQLFGAPAAAGYAVSSLNLKLRGVFADSAGAQAFAIVNTGGRDETARAGREIVPGVLLESVHPRHIVLRRNGALERVNLEERMVVAQAPTTTLPRSPAAAPAPAAPQSAAPQSAPAASEPRSGPGGRFKRPEPYAPVGDVPTEPEPPPAAKPAAPRPAPAKSGEASGNGLVVQAVPPGSLLERIGLQPGDVIRTVNGEPVTTEADVARAVQARGVAATHHAEIVRNGTAIPVAVNPMR
jgi:general secretion pathway protein C